MSQIRVQPARGLKHVAKGRRRGQEVLLPPAGETILVGLLHPSFIAQWIHYDVNLKRDVPHFSPDSCCPFCRACGYHDPRCYLHIGCTRKGIAGKTFMLKIPDTAIEHCDVVRELNEKGDLAGRCLYAFRMNKKKCGPVKIELSDIPRREVQEGFAFDLEIAVDRLYHITEQQKLAEQFAASM
jgi:hypothetical protein